MYCTGAGTSPPQPLYPYEDIPTTIQGIAPLIQISPQVNTHYCIMARGIFYGINFCDLPLLQTLCAFNFAVFNL